MIMGKVSTMIDVNINSKVIDSAQVRVSPELAKRWLQRIPPNQRPLQLNRVASYASAMAEGRWIHMTSSIQFDVDGQCIDGQHRLHAVIKSMMTIGFIVTVGLPSTAINVIDRNKTRSVGDSLHMGGESNWHQLAGGIKWAWKYERGTVTGSDAPDPAQALAWLASHPDIRTGVHYGRMVKDIVQPSLGTALYYIFQQQDQVQAKFFLEHLADGTELSKENHTSGILWLRERMVGVKKLPGISFNAPDKMALAIKAWNALRRRIVVRLLKWSRQSEDFPTAL